MSGDGEWRLQAACRGRSLAWWLPDTGGVSRDNQRALDLCRGCPVRVECRDYYRAADPAPSSIIAGGWRWDVKGRPTRAAGDEHLPARLPKETR